ncbi:MAG: RNA-binding cell elongation regulator Jag/EloR [Ilumatobacteraceae bacterium]
METTGRTVDEAKNQALDQLGVAEDDAEIVVLEEPKPGLFGRVRGEARVRVRVRPTQARPKAERRDRKKKSDQGAPADTGAVSTIDTDDIEAPAPKTPKQASKSSGRSGGRPKKSANEAAAAEQPAPKRSSNEQEKENTVDAAQVGAEAQTFVQGLVEAFGLTGSVTVSQDGDDLEVNVEGADLGLLVGPRGVTLQAVQELTRVAAQRRLGDHDTRLRVDVAGYRERRRVALGAFAEQVAAQVVAEGVAKRLEPMSSADRKIVHDALAEFDGVATRSEGDDPRRCVVIAPANA